MALAWQLIAGWRRATLAAVACLHNAACYLVALLKAPQQLGVPRERRIAAACQRIDSV
jgi:hypothetical protein